MKNDSNDQNFQPKKKKKKKEVLETNKDIKISTLIFLNSRN